MESLTDLLPLAIAAAHAIFAACYIPVRRKACEAYCRSIAGPIAIQDWQREKYRRYRSTDSLLWAASVNCLFLCFASWLWLQTSAHLNTAVLITSALIIAAGIIAAGRAAGTCFQREKDVRYRYGL